MSPVLKSVVNWLIVVLRAVVNWLIVNWLSILLFVLFGLGTILLGLKTWEIQQSANPMIGCPPPSNCINSSAKIKSKCCQAPLINLPNAKSGLWQKLKFWQQ